MWMTSQWSPTPRLQSRLSSLHSSSISSLGNLDLWSTFLELRSPETGPPELSDCLRSSISLTSLPDMTSQTAHPFPLPWILELDFLRTCVLRLQKTLRR